jgi:hypothetical protein
MKPLTFVLTVLAPFMAFGQGELGFRERFALAPDRDKTLGELVPGTRDYYFFHALHFQHTRDIARLNDILDQWRKRMPEEDPQRRMIQNREALLNYERDPKATADYLIDHLGIHHDHQQEARDQKPDLPTELDPAKIARDVFLRDTLTYDRELQSLSQEALAALIRDQIALTPPQRRAVLQQLQRPDVPNLVQAIVTDLQANKGRTFGELPIHRALLPEQLDQLLVTLPNLLNEQAFIFARLRKLAPSADVNIEFDAAERDAWLERVWAFAQKLPPAQNTLKSRVLYLRLDHDRKKGVYDRGRFVEYLKLPRRTGYINPHLLDVSSYVLSDLNADLSEPLLMAPPLGDDEALVREYFLHLFAQDAKEDSDPAQLLASWTPYVRDTWLKPALAEALIVNGIGNAERWASLITPAAFQALKDRVDIDFPATNLPTFLPGEDIRFDVDLKNTPKLIIKIFEINTLNFFQTQQRQLNTDLNLDGLVANSEQTLSFDTGPFKRTRQNFNFPDLKGRRGAWIIEFIGGGRSSRALVRVGQWQVVQQSGPSGDLITVLDEKHQPVEDAVVWFQGRKLVRHEKLGHIVVPFTHEPGLKPLIVGDAAGTFASLAQFQHHAEEYHLDAQFHIEREQLLAHREATLAVRVTLRAGEVPIPPELLVTPRLALTSTTHDGISTTREVKDLKLTAAGVLTHKFMVPERLAALAVTLTGKVEVFSAGGEKRDVSASHTWALNGIDKTEAVSDGHLSTFAGQRVFELLGKNGEPIPDQQVVFTFKHRDFGRVQTIQLRTDEKGRVQLGDLAEIEMVTARIPNGRQSSWPLVEKEHTFTSAIHVQEGEIVRVPDATRGAEPVSLLAESAGAFTADHGSLIKREFGFLTIAGLPAGDYSLRLPYEDRVITIKVARGAALGGWVLGTHRQLELKGAAPLHIAAVETGADVVTVQLAHSSRFARVHVAATRFDPGTGLFGGLSGFPRFGAASGTPAHLPNLYSTGRQIGDEYRYILERRYSKAYPGNMLTRPGLLLNPWEVRKTGPEALHQQGGTAPAATAGGAAGAMSEGKPQSSKEKEDAELQRLAGANLDFIANSAPVLYNLVPDENGIVRIDRKALGDRQHIQIYAEDLHNASWRAVTLPEAGTKFADQRFARNLDPAKLFTQKKEIAVLKAGETLTLADTLTSDLENYDTLGGIHSLFTTLSGNADLGKFAFILDWPKLSAADKRVRYNEHACHELSFFLSRKDKAFFDEVIKPYLANKKDKTFLDDYLLGRGLQSYLQPWAYAQLNIVERILLGQRIENEAPNAARHVRELWEMIPPNPEEADRLFEAALRGKAMEIEGNSYIGRTEVRHKNMRRDADDGGLMAADPFSANPTPPAPAPARAPSGPMAGAEFSDELKNSGAGMLNMVGDKRSSVEERAIAKAVAVEDDIPVYTTQKTHQIILPKVHFAGASLQEAIETLREMTRELDINEPDPDKKGVKITLAPGVASSDAKISLDLTDVPITEALRYVTELAGMKYKVEPYGVVVVPASHTTTEAFQNLDFERFPISRAQSQIFYRHLGSTKEWAENNYYKLRIAEHNADLITVNAFWRDYAAWVAAGSNGGFVSSNVAEAAGNFAEMMLALAVLDLPFEAAEHKTKTENGQFTFTAGGPCILYHQQIKPAAGQDAAQGQLLISQSFFRHGDRYRQEGNEKFEKYVTTEFLTGVTYGANVVVTNPTSSPVKAVVLMQIPQGALPVLGSKTTESRQVRLDAYTTQTFEYHFYFPHVPAQPGMKFAHFPVNVSTSTGAAVAAKPFEFNVVAKLTEVDKASWDYISQYGSDADVFAFLEQNNLSLLDLDRIAWRCRQSGDFYRRLITFLRTHHLRNDAVFSYALLHQDAATLGEWLKFREDFAEQCGPYLASALLHLDPIERRVFEHLEYSPLVNQRAHRLGREWRIANPAVFQEYSALLHVLAFKPQLDAIDNMSVVYFLFLQDRIEEALARFKTIDAAKLPTRLQYDYLKCYAAFFEGDLASARGLAGKYTDHPVQRWRLLFADVTDYLNEIEGEAAKLEKGDQPDREKQQTQLASTDPSFDFKVESQTIALNWRNLREVTLNYYLMDPEFSFSSNPFVSQDSARFSIIKPNQTAARALPDNRGSLAIPLPAEFSRANVLVEIIGAGQRKTQAYHASTLQLTLSENYGRIEARDSGTGKSVPKAYIKVYARLNNGAVRFFKDGYTDLRGRFDYASLNGPEMELPPTPLPASATASGSLDHQMLTPTELREVDKLAILVLSDTHGAAVKEVKPPAR